MLKKNKNTQKNTKKTIQKNKRIKDHKSIINEIERRIPKSKKKKKRKTIPHKSPMRTKKKIERLKELTPKNFINFDSVGSIARWILELGIVCLLAFVFVWYFGQRVSNVGESMSPVVSNGDVVLVDRFIYNASSPHRGDVVVFKPKGNPNSHYYIKRIVGLPGEEIEIIEGSIYTDGEKFEEEYETTPITDVGVVTSKIKLGGDEYFVLGDNRERSEDSRMADIGNIKRSNIYGKAWFIVSPFSKIGHIGK